MILVTGATGKVGSETVRLLRQREMPVRALVRNPEKAAALAQAGAEIAVGDLEAPLTLDEAMKGITTVVLVSPGMPAQELNVVHSAARAGAGHVVKITSNASADSPIARRRWQAEIEAGLIASGLGHTLLRSNAYMQNTLALAPAIAKTSSFGSSTGTGRLGMIDTRDVGAVAAEIAASPVPHEGKTYWLTGPELLSYSDVAEVLFDGAGQADHLPPAQLLRRQGGNDPGRPPRAGSRDERPGVRAGCGRRRGLGHRGRAVAPRSAGAFLRAVCHRSRCGLLLKRDEAGRRRHLRVRGPVR